MTTFLLRVKQSPIKLSMVLTGNKRIHIALIRPVKTLTLVSFQTLISVSKRRRIKRSF